MWVRCTTTAVVLGDLLGQRSSLDGGGDVDLMYYNSGGFQGSSWLKSTVTAIAEPGMATLVHGFVVYLLFLQYILCPVLSWVLRAKYRHVFIVHSTIEIYASIRNIRSIFL